MKNLADASDLIHAYFFPRDLNPALGFTFGWDWRFGLGFATGLTTADFCLVARVCRGPVIFSQYFLSKSPSIKLSDVNHEFSEFG